MPALDSVEGEVCDLSEQVNATMLVIQFCYLFPQVRRHSTAFDVVASTVLPQFFFEFA
jgi:hypothetical protein